MESGFSIGSIVAHIKADLTGFSQGIEQAKGESESLKSSLHGLSSGGDETGLSFGKLAGAFAIGAEAAQFFNEGIGKGIEVLKSTFDETTRGQYALAQLDAAIRSTGGAAGVTTQEMVDYSMSLEKTNSVSHITIQAIESMLLSFNNLSGDALKKATQATLDIAARMGIDATSAAMRLGEALQNPATGMMLLRRTGLSLSAQQKQMVTDFTDAGDTANAQKVILDALATSMGGAGAAAAQTLGGRIKELGLLFDDAKQRVGNMIGNALQPYIDKVIDWVSAHQQMIASAIGTIIVIGALGAAIVGLVATVGIAVAIIGGPLTFLLAALAVLTGGIVFNAFQNLQHQFRETANAGVAGMTNLGNAGATGLSKAAQAAQKLADKLHDLDDQIAKSNQTFKEQLADIVIKHQQATDDLKQQLSQEVSDFADAQNQKQEDYQNRQDQMKQTHADTVATIKDQLNQELTASQVTDTAATTSLRTSIAVKTLELGKYQGVALEAKQIELDAEKAKLAAELIKNQSTNAAKITNLQEKLADEQAKYAKSMKDLDDKYQDDLKKATDAHQKKLDSLQDKLDKETAFLQKHATEVAAVRDLNLRDEIDKLEESHQAQIKSYEKQKQDAIESAKQTTAGMAGQFNSLPGQVKSGLLNGVGTQMGQDMARALKQSLLDSFNNLGSWIAGNAYVLTQRLADEAKSLLGGKSLQQAVQDAARSHPFIPMASGGRPTPGQVHLVGEKGPELFVPDQAGSIIPNDKMGGTTTNINGNIILQNDVDVDNFFKRLTRNQELAKRGLTSAPGSLG